MNLEYLMAFPVDFEVCSIKLIEIIADFHCFS